MKLVMTLLVRDEEDVLRANIDFHRAQGVDFFIVTDNKSEDSTPDIIKDFAQQGIAKYIYEDADDYNQSAWVTRMARMAAADYAADWVINNDADEFWWPRTGDLKSSFAQVGDGQNIVVGPRHDFVALNEETGAFFDDMVYRQKISLNSLGKPLPPKVAHRAHRDVEIAQGNHWAELPGGTDKSGVLEGLLDIFHFPLRSYAQFTNKIIKGGQAYERNKTHNANVGSTWRKLYKEYQKNGLVDYYRKQTFAPQQITAALTAGSLISDRRLADYMYGLTVK